MVTLAAGLLIVAMTYFPTVFVVSNSLKSGRNLFTNGVFTLFTQFDFQNYALAWSGISQPLLNTVIVACLSIVIGVVAAALGAYAFSQLKFRGKSVLFMAYVGLLLVPWTLTLIPLFLTVQKLHMYNTWWALILPYAATAQPLLVPDLPRLFRPGARGTLQSARVDGCSERQVCLGGSWPPDPAHPVHGGHPGGHQRLGRLPVADYRHPGSPGAHHFRRAGQFVASFGTNLSNGGAVFAAYDIVTAPMFLLVGFTMRFRLRPHRRSVETVSWTTGARRLRCAHKDAPLGVEADRVRFSWAVAGRGRGAGTDRLPGPSGPARRRPRGEAGWLWDSGRTECHGSTDVAYAGAPLEPGRRYHWKARVWDEAGQPGPWSRRRRSKRRWARARGGRAVPGRAGAGGEPFDRTLGRAAPSTP